ncbi:MAG: hybrid sensor histidine kinase/response regulator [Candidatus Riflebacteria bacterium]|nr:hybrid sensor histidine kinase/response regulator [Candidatus Riflebacteria bacterium]
MMEAEKKKVLVVDDVMENIELLGGILDSDYEVMMALNGLKALKIAESSDPPDIILLDIMMPEMDGYEVCRKLKQNPKLQNIPIIFVTARNEEIDEAHGLEAGAVDYLTKPVSPAIVLARVKTHLQLAMAVKDLAKQNELLQENLRLREDVDRITRHDLKSPLGGISSLLSIMSDEPSLSAEHRGWIDAMRSSVLRLMEMISHSLDLYKMERGTYRVKAVSINLLAVIRQIFLDLSSLAECRQVSFSLLLDGTYPAADDHFIVSGEEFLFYSMLSNLVKNAIEASPANEKVVVSVQSHPGKHIDISNLGEIPVAIRDRFFQSYTTSGKKDGTGLGTYSAQLMARTLGGKIRFSTNAETGTTITVELP